MSYATDTNVSVEKTRAEIESMLQRRGSTQTAFATETRRAVVLFVINNTSVRFELPLPDRDDKHFTQVAGAYGKIRVRPPDLAYKAWEQHCRSLWRALFLCIKAKLEACEAKITTFEAEFLAHIVSGPNGRTVGDEIIPQIIAMRDTGKQPLLQIGWNGASQ